PPAPPASRIPLDRHSPKRSRPRGSAPVRLQSFQCSPPAVLHLKAACAALGFRGRIRVDAKRTSKGMPQDRRRHGVRTRQRAVGPSSSLALGFSYIPVVFLIPS